MKMQWEHLTIVVQTEKERFYVMVISKRFRELAKRYCHQILPSIKFGNIRIRDFNVRAGEFVGTWEKKSCSQD